MPPLLHLPLVQFLVLILMLSLGLEPPRFLQFCVAILMLFSFLWCVLYILYSENLLVYMSVLNTPTMLWPIFVLSSPIDLFLVYVWTFINSSYFTLS
jgi:hypothetical protein